MAEAIGCHDLSKSPHRARSWPDCASLVAFARSPTDEFICSLFGRRPHRCRKASAIQILPNSLASGDPGHQAQGQPICAARQGTARQFFDRHTLPNWTALTESETRRVHVDKGCRGHNHAQKFRVWISGQCAASSPRSARGMGRRALVEPVIGHIKTEHPMLGPDPRSGRRDPQSRPKCV
jgi:hypothetical protein